MFWDRTLNRVLGESHLPLKLRFKSASSQWKQGQGVEQPLDPFSSSISPCFTPWFIIYLFILISNKELLKTFCTPGTRKAEGKEMNTDPALRGAGRLLG